MRNNESCTCILKFNNRLYNLKWKLLKFTYLYLSWFSSAVHSASNINGVSPNIILRFLRSYNTSNYWTDIQTYRKKNANSEELFSPMLNALLHFFASQAFFDLFGINHFDFNLVLVKVVEVKNIKLFYNNLLLKCADVLGHIW